MSRTGPDSVSAGAARLKSWLETSALPFWAEIGAADDGGFYEILALDAKPVKDAIRRLRVQARQIYVYSHATVLGLGDWRALSLKGFEWLIQHGYDPDEGGFVHLLDGDGAFYDARKDTYDHAFVLLALAWLYRATGEKAVLDWSDRVLDYLDTRLKAPGEDGYYEGHPATVPRRQNPHMHLFEAFLALHDVTGEADYLGRCEKIAGLFQKTFFCIKTDTVTEYFDAAWKPVEGEAGRIVEPGHLFEWSALLYDYAQKTGRDVPEEALRCFETARSRGMDASAGLALDEIWKDRGVRKATKRCWPQTEALRAHLRLEQRRPGNGPSAAGFTDALFRYYLDPAPEGTWIDMRGPDNEPAATTIPASTFYHLISAYASLCEVPAQAGAAALATGEPK